MKDTTIPLQFTFRVEHIPPRCRNPRPAYVRANGFGSLREASLHDAVQPAFRIERTNARGDAFLSQVLSCGEDFWWPITYRGRAVKARELVFGLSCGMDEAIAALGCEVPMARRYVYSRIDALETRKLLKSTEDEVRLAIQRELVELRTYGGYVYVTGAEPVYVCRLSFKGRPWRVDVIRPPSRVDDGGPEIALGKMPLVDFDVLAMKGMVFTADELAAAQALIPDGGEGSVAAQICPYASRRASTDVIALELGAAVRSLASCLSWGEHYEGETGIAALQEIRALARYTQIPKEQAASALQSYVSAREQAGTDKEGSPLYAAYREAAEAIDRITANSSKRNLPSPFRFQDQLDEHYLSGMFDTQESNSGGCGGVGEQSG